jgi:parallel beta-helix repeat protein
LGRFRAGLVSGVWVLVLFVTVFGVALNVPIVWGSGTIYIRVDGSIDGPANITTVDCVTYYFNESNYDEIVVERDNIIIDGNGYTIQGSGSGYGFNLTSINNVTIQNTNIKDFDYGILLEGSSNDSITGNNITNNYVGIYLHASSNNNIANNTVTNNRDFGIWLRESSVNRISGNNITNNRDGIDLSGSSNNTISGNLFMRDGLSVWDSYGNVVLDNFVNGKPLVYLEDVSHQSVGDAGQVILVNCQHITVENLNPSNTNIGVQLWQTNNTIIQGNNITANNEHGIWLYESSNNSVIGNNVTNNGYGIYLYESSNNSVSGNNVTNNYYSGIVLPGPSNNNSILGNSVTANYYHGISLSWSSNNSILDNNVTANGYNGIDLSWFSNDNNVHGNNVTNNWKGIYLDRCSNNTFRTNHMSSNGLNFGVGGEILSHFINDIDASNTVDDKLIYYLVNRQNEIVPLDAGYVALINSTNVTALNLNLKNNPEGILLAYTNNSLITRSIITNNDHGMKLVYSFNNTISGNSIDNNYYRGVLLDGSSYNTVTNNTVTNSGGSGVYISYSSNHNMVLGNNITNNAYGIYVASSSSNTICKNNIVNNIPYGIYIHYSSNNVVYHNNFISNAVQVYSVGSVNVWDDGYPSGGSYWSNYVGVDSNRDGIDDLNYTIDVDNVDRYPLMGMFHDFNTSSGYPIEIVSNSTIEDFEYFESNNTLFMHVSNMTSNQTFGFIRICIPHALMNETYHVTIDGAEPYYVNYTLYDNGTHRWIYFSYQHSTLEVVITPEFPLFLILPLLMIATLLAVIFYKRKRPI